MPEKEIFLKQKPRYEIIFWKIFKKRFVFSAKVINVFQNTFNLYQQNTEFVKIFRDLLLQEMTDFDIKRLSLNYVSTISIYSFSTKNTKTRTVKLRFRYASRVNTLYLFNKNMDLVLIVTVYTL